MDEAELSKMRKRIDAIDRVLVSQLLARMRLARRVRRAKANYEEAVPTTRSALDIAREEEVVRRVLKRADPELAPYVERVMRELIGASLAFQQPVRIAYLGPAGTFSHEIARARFSHSAELIPRPTINSCFDVVERQHVFAALVPYENSTEGGVGETLDCLVATNLVACGEAELRVRQNLLAAEGAGLTDLTKVYAHAQSFAQCRNWLASHLPRVEYITCSSNAAAAEAAVAAGPSAAAAGPQGAASGRNLSVLVPDIEDYCHNVTRFLLIGRNKVRPTGYDKTSFWFATKHEPGAMFRQLSVLDKHKINMTRLESRPRPGSAMGNYVFFVDVEGHCARPPLAAALKEFATSALEMKVIGSYPRAAAGPRAS